MQVRRLLHVLPLALLLGAGCSNDTIGPGEIKVSDLAGSWTVIKLQYTANAGPAASVDLVAAGSASGTVVVSSNGSYTMMLTRAGAGTATSGGHFGLSGTQLTDTPNGAPAETVTASRQGDIVTLVYADTTFDFDGSGPRAATLTTQWQKAPG